MTWWIFAAISVLGLSFSKIFQRMLMKEEGSDPISYSIVFEFLSAVLIGIFVVWHGFVLPPVTKLPWNFFIMAVLYGLGTVFIFKANKLIEASEAAIITPLISIVAIVSSVTFLKESFDLKKLAGTLLILAATLLVAELKKGFVFNKGVLYALAMVVCYGLAITNDAFILHTTKDAASYTAVSFLLVGIFLVIIHPNSLGRVGDFLSTSKLCNMALLGISYSIATVAFFSALQSGAGASQMGPLNQSFVVVTVLLAAVFLGERSNLFKKLVAAVVVLAGVLLLS
jgi:drug/metabolite transporter (DMT)-like permease